MGNLIKYGLIAAVLVAVFMFNDSDKNSYAGDIDLKAVLDVTAATATTYQESIKGQTEPDPDETFLGFAKSLEQNYNRAQPPLHTKNIGVSPQTNASLLAYEDANTNQQKDEGEAALFLIEIDGEKQRIIASGRNGAVNEHHFSGTSLITGYLIGSMLSRQRSAGVNSQQLASKKPVTARAAASARSRAGSGSHSRGK